MSSRTRVGLTVSLAAGVALLCSAAPAAATTFCVPTFHAACPDNGINLAQADLETAMEANADDGIPDRAIIDATTITDPDSFHATGSDDLEVVGAGPGKTTLTTSSTASTWVVNLDFTSTREVTMRDLKILVPATIGANSSALHTNGDRLINVDIETRRADVQGVSPAEGGTTFRDGELYGTGGGSFGFGFWVPTSVAQDGTLRIERTRIGDSDRGVSVDAPGNPLALRAVQVIDPAESAVAVSGSNDVTVENTVLESGTSSPIYLFSNTPQKQTVELTNITLDSSTGDATKPAILGQVQAVSGTGSIDIDVNSSLIRGFDKTWELSSPAGNVSIGDAYISLRYSNFLPSGTNAGSGTSYVAPNNTEGDPLFRGPGDYRLKAGSPAIDKGDPALGFTSDLLGQTHSVDGNGDGFGLPDQGAYEYVPPKQPEPACETQPSLCPKPPTDTTPPKVSKVKFLPPGKKAGSLKFTLSESASVKVAFKPTPAGKGKKKRKTVKLSKRGKAGVNTLTIKKGKLKPGGYRLTITATDAAGNGSGRLTGKVKVKRRP